MNLKKALGAAVLALSLSAPVLAQAANGGQPDQVDQLAKMVNLSDDQQTQIRDILKEMQGKIGDLRQQATELQKDMESEIKADYDEAKIRKDAEKLGDLTGEIAALSTIMQAQVDGVFTQEQRDELDKRVKQMQAQMQQQRQMMQMQQMQQQQKQGKSAE